MTIKEGRFSKETIMYYSEFYIYKKFKRTNTEGTLILTNNMILFCRNHRKVFYKNRISNIRDVEVFEGGRVGKEQHKLYHIYVYTHQNRNFVFETIKYSQAHKTYTFLRHLMDMKD